MVSLILLVAATSVQGKDQGAGRFKNTFVEEEPARTMMGYSCESTVRTGDTSEFMAIMVL